MTRDSWSLDPPSTWKTRFVAGSSHPIPGLSARSLLSWTCFLPRPFNQYCVFIQAAPAAFNSWLQLAVESHHGCALLFHETTHTQPNSFVSFAPLLSSFFTRTQAYAQQSIPHLSFKVETSGNENSRRKVEEFCPKWLNMTLFATQSVDASHLRPLQLGPSLPGTWAQDLNTDVAMATVGSHLATRIWWLFFINEFDSKTSSGL